MILTHWDFCQNPSQKGHHIFNFFHIGKKQPEIDALWTFLKEDIAPSTCSTFRRNNLKLTHWGFCRIVLQKRTSHYQLFPLWGQRTWNWRIEIYVMSFHKEDFASTTCATVGRMNIKLTQHLGLLPWLFRMGTSHYQLVLLWGEWIDAESTD